jgi:hypothetical protein
VTHGPAWAIATSERDNHPLETVKLAQFHPRPSPGPLADCGCWAGQTSACFTLHSQALCIFWPAA